MEVSKPQTVKEKSRQMYLSAGVHCTQMRCFKTVNGRVGTRDRLVKVIDISTEDWNVSKP